MINGIGKEESEMQERGKNILNALTSYRSEVNPNEYKTFDFETFVSDPFQQKAKIDDDQRDLDKIESFNKEIVYRRALK